MSEILHEASATTGAEPFRTDVSIGSEPRFTQITDTPASQGGKDLGASPVAQLTAALASCKTITGKMYADRKGWPLEAIRVDVRHVRKDVNGRPGDAFECDVHLEGDLDAEQRKRIYEITAKCPVHKMLMGETPVESALSDG